VIGRIFRRESCDRNKKKLEMKWIRHMPKRRITTKNGYQRKKIGETDKMLDWVITEGCGKVK